MRTRRNHRKLKKSKKFKKKGGYRFFKCTDKIFRNEKPYYLKHCCNNWYNWRSEKRRQRCATLKQPPINFLSENKNKQPPINFLSEAKGVSEDPINNFPSFPSEAISIPTQVTLDTFFNDNGYKIITIPGDGNCFISSYLTALNSYSKENVQAIRNFMAKKIIENVTSDDYETYKIASEDPTVQNIATVKDFAEYAKSQNYYIDYLTINLLQESLGFQVIVILLENNKYSLQCAPVNRKNPDKYVIMLNTNNIHFDVVSYKNQTNFTFKSLPMTLKQKLKENCFDTSKGYTPYMNISDFREFFLKR